MIYVMSDLHGEYEKYKEMLEQINFNDNDTLYILGDIVDRGKNGLKIILDMMVHSNIIPILGNHEHIAVDCLTWLKDEITEETLKTLDEGKMLDISDWLNIGGLTTINEFKKLDEESKKEVLEYLLEFSLYEQVEVNNRNFLLVHSGLGNYKPNKKLDEYNIGELIWERHDYDQTYSEDANFYVVSGHTPTLVITGKPEIYHNNQCIVIDCGAPFKNGRLACLCLDNMQEFYV